MAVLTGCAEVGDDEVGSIAVGIDMRTHALTVGNEITSLEGTYNGCAGHTGGSTWSLNIPSSGADSLSVARGDSACTLRVTKLVRSSGAQFTNAPGLTLTDSFAVTATPYTLAGETVYANARLSAATFTSDFTITLLYSDDPSATAASNTAAYTEHKATAAASHVQAPDYTLALAGITVSTDVADVIYQTSGNAVLTAGTVTGTKYAIVSTSGLATYAQVDAAYTGATQLAMKTTIPVAEFNLGSADLTGNTTVRTLIVANIVNDLRSYQVFTITFKAAGT